MSNVRVAVELEVELHEGSDPSSTEKAIAAEGRRAARELYRRAVEVLDDEVTASWGGTRQRREARWVATLFGRVRILRYRVRGGGLDERPRGGRGGLSSARGSLRGERKSLNPLDLSLGLTRGEPSQALREFVRELSSMLPEQAITDVVSRVTGEPFSRQGIRRILKMDG